MSTRFIWLCQKFVQIMSHLHLYCKRVRFNGGCSEFVQEQSLQADCKSAGPLEVKPDNVQEVLQVLEIGELWQELTIPHRISNPILSVDMVASTPFHCWTWKYYTYKLWYVAAPEVGGKLCGWTWEVFMATF